MNAEPLVTIGITCFNAEDTILQAIDSALAQTYSNTEIIIVDDASIDASLKVINDILKSSDKLTLVKHKENRGAPSAYNSIIENAKGKYICFFDDDDFSHSDRVEKTVRKLEENTNKSLVCFCDRYVIDNSLSEGKRVIKGLTKNPASPKDATEHMLDTLCYQYDRDYYRKNQVKYISLKQHGLTGSSAGTGIMTAPTAVLKKHMFDSKMFRFCDTELNLRLFTDGVGAINVDEPLMTQNVTSGADKASFIEKESVYHALTKHKKTYKKYGVYYSRVFTIDEEFADSSTLKNNKNLPLVTIAICAENTEETIFDVVKSALYQTYPNVEVIVVDNSSSDSTMDILSRFNDPRLNVSRNKIKLPKAENYNQILSEAAGKYTVFFDDKDITLKHRVESQVLNLLEKKTDLPLLSIADYYDYLSGFSGVHHCLGNLGNGVDSDELMAVIWHVILRHSEAKYLLTESPVPFFEYSLFAELLCGETLLLKKLGFDSSCADSLIGLDLLMKLSEKGGMLVNKGQPLVYKNVNPLKVGDWPETVKESNIFIAKHREKFEQAFDTDSKSVLDRNALKEKLLRRMALIRSYLD